MKKLLRWLLSDICLHNWTLINQSTLIPTPEHQSPHADIGVQMALTIFYEPYLHTTPVVSSSAT